MNRFGNLCKPRMWLMALLLAALALVAGCGDSDDNSGGGGGGTGPGAGSTGGVCAGADCVSLGTTANYVILAQTAITNISTSVVTGNMGITPAFAANITGFGTPALDATNDFSTSSEVTGKIYAPDYTGGQPGSAGTTPAQMTTAQTDMTTAYNDAAGKTSTAGCPGVGNMGGLTLAPGVYTCAVNVTIQTANNLTLNGSATDVWVFQITGTLTQAASTQVILTGGALPKNVFWQVSDVVVIEPSAVMQGIILGFSTIAMQNGASINGRLLGKTDVTLIANTVTQP